MLSKSLQSLRTWVAIFFMTAPISYFCTPPEAAEVTTNWQLVKSISDYVYKKEPEKSCIELIRNLEMKKLFEKLSSKINEFIENFDVKQLQENKLIIQILFSTAVVGLSIILIKRFFKRSITMIKKMLITVFIKTLRYIKNCCDYKQNEKRQKCLEILKEVENKIIECQIQVKTCEDIISKNDFLQTSNEGDLVKKMLDVQLAKVTNNLDEVSGMDSKIGSLLED